MRVADLDLNLLLIFVTLYRERSVTQAGQELELSASAVSKGLGRLRDHFEDPLFISMPSGMVPTPFAEILAPEIHDIMAAVHVAIKKRPAFNPGGSHRCFRIACSDYTFTIYITHVIRRLQHVAPDIQLCCILTNEQTPNLMREGDLDFAVVPRERLVDDHPSETVFIDDFSCVVWDGNRLVGETLSLDTFLKSRHISTMLGSRHIPHLHDEAFERHGLRPVVTMWAPNFVSVAQAIVGTNLIATMHSRSARFASAQLPVRVLPPPVVLRPFTEMLQWHRRASEDPGIIWMRDLLLAVGRALN